MSFEPRGFDQDNHLTGEVKKSLADDQKISPEEANFIAKIIDKHGGRGNIKIKKSQLIQLAKAFNLNYSKLSKIGPELERRIKARASIINDTKGQLKGITEDVSKNKY
ncbi:MAG: hypothetical protein Q9M97_02785 [Candidatus Gracilibacteria bacterium]|nr:hypothetical protein [Candidatus Gracilibacteria bacterium]